MEGVQLQELQAKREELLISRKELEPTREVLKDQSNAAMEQTGILPMQELSSPHGLT